jgi:predicted DsbA family dithiol-disulfide isomerase
LTRVSWRLLASQAGIADTSWFALCFQSSTPRERLAHDQQLARKAGLTSVPSIVVGRKIYVGALPSPILRSILRGK